MILTIAGFMLAIFTNGQDDCDIKPSRKSNRSLEDARDLLAENRFNEAQKAFQESLSYDSLNLDARNELAYLFQRLNNVSAAFKQFELIVAQCEDYDWDVYYQLGQLASKMGKHQVSVNYLERYLSKKTLPVATKLLEREKKLNYWYSNPVPYDPQVVEGISTVDDEYLASITADERQIYFTRRYQKQSKTSFVAKTVEEFTLSNLVNGTFTKGEGLNYPFNQNSNEGGPTLTATNNEMYMTICEVDEKGLMNCDIFYTHKKYGDWEELQRLPSPINKPDSWESQPSISADGKTLFFVSSREGGQGGLDIYYAQKLPNNTWSKAFNLGPVVNTSKDDKAPFIHTDSKTIYFASQGHDGLGGYDMYKFNMQDSSLMNLGYPINTPEDELGLFVSLSGKQAFFASNQLSGKGGWDLYTFELYEDAQPEEVFMVRGKVDDPMVIPDIKIQNLRTNETMEVEVDSISGDYVAILDRSNKDDYIMTINKPGFAFSSEYIAGEQLNELGLYETTAQLKDLELGEEYPLRNINFKTDSYQLNKMAKAEIRAFAAYLQTNTKMHVSIEGHTDNVGGALDNQLLSEQRAKAVYNELIEAGVKSNRIKAKGYGASKPIGSNDTEAGRQANRRTVFVITKK